MKLPITIISHKGEYQIEVTARKLVSPAGFEQWEFYATRPVYADPMDECRVGAFGWVITEKSTGAKLLHNEDCAGTITRCQQKLDELCAKYGVEKFKQMFDEYPKFLQKEHDRYVV
jgi:hypothetical protein